MRSRSYQNKNISQGKNEKKSRTKNMNLDWALTYAEAGFPVVPIYGIVNGQCTCRAGVNCPNKPGKHPITEHGKNDATTNPEIIKAWFSKWKVANVAFIIGSSYAVVDVDPKNGGLESFKKLTKKFLFPISTLSATTGSGGKHYLFKKSPDREIYKAEYKNYPGIDFLTGNNYIVAAPSLHIAGKNYEWDGNFDITKAAKAPEWLFNGDLEPKPEPKPESRVYPANKPAPRKNGRMTAEEVENHFRGDWEGFYIELLGNPKNRENGKGELIYKCLFHDDGSRPNLSINKRSGMFQCFSCKARGNWKHIWARVHNLDPETQFVDILEGITEKYSAHVHKLTEGGNGKEIQIAIQAEDQPKEEASAGKKKGKKKEKIPDHTILIDIARSKAELFHYRDEAYATYERDGIYQTSEVNKKPFKEWLALEFWNLKGVGPSDYAIKNALPTILALAKFEGYEIPVYTKICEIQDADKNPIKIYLDLCDSKWRVVEIDAKGWKVLDKSPVKFIRKGGVLPLPLPIEGGNITELRDILNIKDEKSWVMIAGWILGTFRAEIAFPILVPKGEQGAGKTLATSLIRNVMDPRTLETRSCPKDDRDLAISTKNAWILAYDNISYIHDWLSDAFCRVSTGAGFATRMLYENDEEMEITARRPLILNGIGMITTRPDLIDRSIMIDFTEIPKERRKKEEDIRAEFRKNHPQILGAFLAAVAAGIKNLPKTKSKYLPRMASFAAWLIACEEPLWPEGTFEIFYYENIEQANQLMLEGDPLFEAIGLLLDKKKSFEGYVKNLLFEIEDVLKSEYPDDYEKKRKQAGWPKDATRLSMKLTRLSPSLRKVGINVEKQIDMRGTKISITEAKK